MDEYKGEERRSIVFNQDFYDKMMEMHSDVKHIIKWSEEHDDQDDNRFKEANRKIDINMKFMYMCLGAIAIIQVVLQYSKH